ncbi:MAG: helix-turn-helix domain-containing protein [Saprospiraceae bacterium]
MANPTRFHEFFLKKLQEKTENNSSIAKIVAQVLGISVSTAYKKVRGDVAFSIEECKVLATQFDISIDEWIFPESSRLLAYYSRRNDERASPTFFLSFFHTELTKIRQLPDTKLYYSAFDLPMLWYFAKPELIAFKFFIWNKTNDQEGKLTTTQFTPELFYKQFPDFKQKCEEIFDLYLQIDTEEYWPGLLFAQLINQFRFSLESGYISRSTFESLLDSLLNLNDLLFNQAQKGFKVNTKEKPTGGNLSLYINDLFVTNDTILVLRNDKPVSVYRSLDNPNFIRVEQKWFLENVVNWLDSIRRVSSKISVDGERSRRMYFEATRLRIEEVRERAHRL